MKTITNTWEEYIEAEDWEYSCPTYGKMQSMLHSAKCRAKERGREFNLKLEDLAKLYVEKCPILGIDICWDNKESIAHGSPSLDRIDNNRGYVRGNVQIISHRANSLKKDYLLDEWERVAEYMRSGGGFASVNDEHFSEETKECLTAEVILQIRRERKQGYSLVETADNLQLPFRVVCWYAKVLEQN